MVLPSVVAGSSPATADAKNLLSEHSEATAEKNLSSAVSSEAEMEAMPSLSFSIYLPSLGGKDEKEQHQQQELDPQNPGTAGAAAVLQQDKCASRCRIYDYESEISINDKVHSSGSSSNGGNKNSTSKGVGSESSMNHATARFFGVDGALPTVKAASYSDAVATDQLLDLEGEQPFKSPHTPSSPYSERLPSRRGDICPEEILVSAIDAQELMPRSSKNSCTNICVNKATSTPLTTASSSRSVLCGSLVSPSPTLLCATSPATVLASYPGSCDARSSATAGGADQLSKLPNSTTEASAMEAVKDGEMMDNNAYIASHAVTAATVPNISSVVISPVPMEDDTIALTAAETGGAAESGVGVSYEVKADKREQDQQQESGGESTSASSADTTTKIEVKGDNDDSISTSRSSTRTQRSCRRLAFKRFRGAAAGETTTDAETAEAESAAAVAPVEVPHKKDKKSKGVTFGNAPPGSTRNKNCKEECIYTGLNVATAIIEKQGSNEATRPECSPRRKPERKQQQQDAAASKDLLDSSKVFSSNVERNPGDSCGDFVIASAPSGTSESESGAISNNMAVHGASISVENHSESLFSNDSLTSLGAAAPLLASSSDARCKDKPSADEAKKGSPKSRNRRNSNRVNNGRRHSASEKPGGGECTSSLKNQAAATGEFAAAGDGTQQPHDAGISSQPQRGSEWASVGVNATQQAEQQRQNQEQLLASVAAPVVSSEFVNPLLWSVAVESATGTNADCSTPKLSRSAAAGAVGQHQQQFSFFDAVTPSSPLERNASLLMLACGGSPPVSSPADRLCSSPANSATSAVSAAASPRNTSAATSCNASAAYMASLRSNIAPSAAAVSAAPASDPSSSLPPSQLLHLQSHVAASLGALMVKSVSPAGVVRRGGRNRRKRTKYDLAYRQMELLGSFVEEAKTVDLTKVSGSSFAVELLKNPELYTHEAWVHGFAWPVGADGRRLLLRKLRGVYWSDPDYWQQRLVEEGLYRRDLFTLATVQELFRVTHLMGPAVWDFLLKCTALTHKCEALSSKNPEFTDGEEANGAPAIASSPEALSPRSASRQPASTNAPTMNNSRSSLAGSSRGAGAAAVAAGGGMLSSSSSRLVTTDTALGNSNATSAEEKGSAAAGAAAAAIAAAAGAASDPAVYPWLQASRVTDVLNGKNCDSLIAADRTAFLGRSPSIVNELLLLPGATNASSFSMYRSSDSNLAAEFGNGGMSNTTNTDSCNMFPPPPAALASVGANVDLPVQQMLEAVAAAMEAATMQQQLEQRLGSSGASGCLTRNSVPPVGATSLPCAGIGLVSGNCPTAAGTTCDSTVATDAAEEMGKTSSVSLNNSGGREAATAPQSCSASAAATAAAAWLGSLQQLLPSVVARSTESARTANTAADGTERSSEVRLDNGSNRKGAEDSSAAAAAVDELLQLLASPLPAEKQKSGSSACTHGQKRNAQQLTNREGRVNMLDDDGELVATTQGTSKTAHTEKGEVTAQQQQQSQSASSSSMADLESAACTLESLLSPAFFEQLKAICSSKISSVEPTASGDRDNGATAPLSPAALSATTPARERPCERQNHEGGASDLLQCPRLQQQLKHLSDSEWRESFQGGSQDLKEDATGRKPRFEQMAASVDLLHQGTSQSSNCVGSSPPALKDTHLTLEKDDSPKNLGDSSSGSGSSRKFRSRRAATAATASPAAAPKADLMEEAAVDASVDNDLKNVLMLLEAAGLSAASTASKSTSAQSDPKNQVALPMVTLERKTQQSSSALVDEPQQQPPFPEAGRYISNNDSSSGEGTSKALTGEDVRQVELLIQALQQQISEAQQITASSSLASHSDVKSRSTAAVALHPGQQQRKRLEDLRNEGTAATSYDNSEQQKLLQKQQQQQHSRKKGSRSRSNSSNSSSDDNSSQVLEGIRTAAHDSAESTAEFAAAAAASGEAHNRKRLRENREKDTCTNSSDSCSTNSAQESNCNAGDIMSKSLVSSQQVGGKLPNEFTNIEPAITAAGAGQSTWLESIHALLVSTVGSKNHSQEAVVHPSITSARSSSSFTENASSGSCSSSNNGEKCTTLSTGTELRTKHEDSSVDSSRRIEPSHRRHAHKDSTMFSAHGKISAKMASKKLESVDGATALLCKALQVFSSSAALMPAAARRLTWRQKAILQCAPVRNNCNSDSSVAEDSGIHKRKILSDNISKSSSSSSNSIEYATSSCEGESSNAMSDKKSLSVAADAPPSPSSLLEATHALLQLTAHYDFMAQFMQCAMLLEVQEALQHVMHSLRNRGRSNKSRKSSIPCHVVGTDGERRYWMRSSKRRRRIGSSCSTSSKCSSACRRKFSGRHESSDDQSNSSSDESTQLQKFNGAVAARSARVGNAGDFSAASSDAGAAAATTNKLCGLDRSSKTSYGGNSQDILYNVDGSSAEDDNNSSSKRKCGLGKDFQITSPCQRRGRCGNNSEEVEQRHHPRISHWRSCSTQHRRGRLGVKLEELSRKDDSIKTCLNSLLESGSLHMRFVQGMAQQLQRHLHSPAAGAAVQVCKDTKTPQEEGEEKQTDKSGGKAVAASDSWFDTCAARAVQQTFHQSSSPNKTCSMDSSGCSQEGHCRDNSGEVVDAVARRKRHSSTSCSSGNEKTLAPMLSVSVADREVAVVEDERKQNVYYSSCNSCSNVGGCTGSSSGRDSDNTGYSGNDEDAAQILSRVCERSTGSLSTEKATAASAYLAKRRRLMQPSFKLSCRGGSSSLVAKDEHAVGTPAAIADSDTAAMSSNDAEPAAEVAAVPPAPGNKGSQKKDLHLVSVRDNRESEITTRTANPDNSITKAVAAVIRKSLISPSFRSLARRCDSREGKNTAFASEVKNASSSAAKERNCSSSRRLGLRSGGTAGGTASGTAYTSGQTSCSGSAIEESSRKKAAR